MSKEQTNVCTLTLQPCGYKKCSPCYIKGYESTEIDYVCNYLDAVTENGKLNGVFVDVGAHVGLWSLHMSEWYQHRYNIMPTIYAVEPDSANYVKLRLNAQQAPTGVIPVQVAAWNRNEWLSLKTDENPSRHCVTNIGIQEKCARVRGVMLDSVATSRRQIDVIKIDVEGAELNVLNGARQILIENSQLLVMLEYSITHFEKYGYTVEQITTFMTQHDFQPARPVDKKTIENIRIGDIKRVMFIKGDIA